MEVVASKKGSCKYKRTWEEVVATFTRRRLVSLWRRQSSLWSILKGFNINCWIFPSEWSGVVSDPDCKGAGIDQLDVHWILYVPMGEIHSPRFA